jgi:hypothetical protein
MVELQRLIGGLGPPRGQPSAGGAVLVEQADGGAARGEGAGAGEAG